MPNNQSINEEFKLKQRLTSLWPGLPYLCLGFYLSWSLLLSDTCAWVSDIDATGNAMVNSNLLIKLRGIQCLAAAFVLLIVSLFNRLHERIV